MEAALRLLVFVLVFALTAVLELVLPRRPKTEPVGRRWRINLGILLVDVVAQRLTVGALAVAAALWAEAEGFGLFQLVGWPFWLEAVLGFVALDFAVWLQHVVTHKVPTLWRLHQVHHADLDVDLTTGIRFHPVEIVLSAVYKAALAAVLGIDPWAVILFEAVLNASAVLTHANVGLPERVDTVLRWVVCTPDMHRVHHSIVRAETDSNYGFCLSVWDRLFGTMRHAPAAGQLGAVLGLLQHRDPARLGLGGLLLMPFSGPARPRTGWSGARARSSSPDRGRT
jgi:sterol desaturase/sphingolipid hydroxylase (fatty acid hydroxylase superfamily)